MGGERKGNVLPVVVTNSELGTFRTCRHRWKLAYEEHLTPRNRELHFDAGDGIHIGLATVYRTLHELQTCGAAYDEELVRASARGAVGRYVEEVVAKREARGLPDDEERRVDLLAQVHSGVRLFIDAFAARDFERYRVMEVERAFEVPLIDGRAHTLLRGRRDVVLQDLADGALILGEHKSTRGDASEFDMRLDTDTQTRAYLYAMRHEYRSTKLSVGSVYLNVVRKTVPREPELTKKGLVSAARIETTRAIYERALARQVDERGIAITEEQRALASSLPTVTDRWVSRHDTFIGSAALDSWAADVRADAKLIRAAQTGRLRTTRNGSVCSHPSQQRCPYSPVCVDDTMSLREELYTVREHRHAETVDQPSDE